jgi:hypothetical protein
VLNWKDRIYCCWCEHSLWFVTKKIYFVLRGEDCHFTDNKWHTGRFGILKAQHLARAYGNNNPPPPSFSFDWCVRGRCSKREPTASLLGKLKFIQRAWCSGSNTMTDRMTRTCDMALLAVLGLYYRKINVTGNKPTLLCPDEWSSFARACISKHWFHDR